MREVSLDQLRTFETVVATASFSEAARMLNLTQPAVSHQIKELEARFGLLLIERLGRSAQPTAAGQALLDHARGLLDRAELTAEAMEAWRTGRVGRVRLGADGTLCAFLLPEMLIALRAAHPGLEVRLEGGPSAEIARKVAENALDIALATRPTTIDPALEVTPAISDDLCAFWPATLGPAPDVVTPRDLAAQPLVLFTEGNVTRDLVRDWFGTERPPRAVAELDLGVMIVAMVAAGVGAAILPREAARGAGPPGAVALRPLDPPIPRRVVTLIRRDKPPSRALDIVRAALAETIAASQRAMALPET